MSKHIPIMKKHIQAILIIVISIFSISTTYAQKENKYHKYEISILNTSSSQEQISYIEKINTIFQSKHCSYNSGDSKFIFYTRKYFSADEMKEYLETYKIITSGSITYIAPTSIKTPKNNSSTN